MRSGITETDVSRGKWQEQSAIQGAEETGPWNASGPRQKLT